MNDDAHPTEIPSSDDRPVGDIPAPTDLMGYDPFVSTPSVAIPPPFHAGMTVAPTRAPSWHRRARTHPRNHVRTRWTGEVVDTVPFVRDHRGTMHPLAYPSGSGIPRVPPADPWFAQFGVEPPDSDRGENDSIFVGIGT